MASPKLGSNLPSVPKVKIGSVPGGRKGPKTNYDPVKLMKRFFLYRNVFGNMTGAPGKPTVGGNPGDVEAFTAGRHMGIF